MIDINKACEIAVDYFKKEQGKTGVCEILDAGNVWIIFGGNEGEVEIGAVDITVNKDDGTIALFILPSSENFELMNNAVEIDVPQEFKAK